MKKKLSSLLIVFGIILFISCEDTKKSDSSSTLLLLMVTQTAQVQFQNNLSDGDVLYGIKFGGAEYRYALLRGGSTTPYISTLAGSYPVELLNASGVWINDTGAGRLAIEGGKNYRIRIEGTLASYTYLLDLMP